MSAIFLLPVCLTYSPRKYTTRVDPHFDNSYQVWSWYVHILPSYSVFVCWYITDFVTLTFELWTLSSCCAWRVTWPTLLLSLKTLCLFAVLDFKSWAYSRIYGHFQQHLYCACAETVIYIFRRKFRHHPSISRPRFPTGVQNFGDLATFSVDFCVLYSECPPYF